MKHRPLDLDKIAKGLGAERRGPLPARSGYFAAAELAASVLDRFRVPAGGGRATDPKWTERRLVPLAPQTLAHLEKLAKALSQDATPSIGPLQVAALLLEHALTQIDPDILEDLAQRLRRG